MTGTILRCAGEIARFEGRGQETYDIIEIGVIINAGKPGLIGGARMRERDGSADQKGQQHGAQAIGARGIQAVENGHSRLVRAGRSWVGRATLWDWRNRLSTQFF